MRVTVIKDDNILEVDKENQVPIIKHPTKNLGVQNEDIKTTPKKFYLLLLSTQHNGQKEEIHLNL